MVVVGEPDELVVVSPSKVVVVCPGRVDPVVDVASEASPVQAAATSSKTVRRGASRRTIRSQVIGGEGLDLGTQVGIGIVCLVPSRLMFNRTASLVVAAALILAACGGDSTGGALEAVIDPAGETSGFGDFTAGRDKSFGVFVCTRGGPVEIVSVAPALTEGDIEYLGATVYTSDEMFVGAAHGYPPDGIDEAKLSDVEGGAIEADCSDSGGEKVQLLIGAERTGIGGGVLDGFVVIYGDAELEIPFTILMCGDEMEFCEALIPAPTTMVPEDS